MKFPKLFEPIKIGNVEVKNRIMFLATQTLYSPQGHLGDRFVNYYQARAKGGAGLINVGIIFTFNWDTLNVLRLHDDSFIPEYRRLVNVIHSYGTAAFAQIGVEHLWRRSLSEPMEVVGPSGISIVKSRPNVRILSIPEIKQIEDEHADTVLRCREAGFKGVEIHAGTGFLLNQFMSPNTNKRTDEYGGNLENRLRILKNIVEKARKQAGKDFPLIAKISGVDFMEGGYSFEEWIKIAPLLEDMGLDALNVAVGWHESQTNTVTSQIPEGHWSYISASIKKVVKIPVISTYRIATPEVAEDILAQGKADMVGMARGLIADPELPNLAKEGRLEDLRPCIVCCLCLDQAFTASETKCSVNPRLGREKETELKPAMIKKKVLVVGGGPAGMEAARVAAFRDHRVILMEKEKKLGGQLISASIPPFKGDIAKLTRYFTGQLKKNGVEIRAGVEATADMAARENFNEIILATGAIPNIPDIPGIKLSNVYNPVEVLTGVREIPGDKVVVLGGGFIGCETADFLSERGKKVIITSRQEKIGHDVGITVRWPLLWKLRTKGVKMEPRTMPVEITEKGVRALQDGKEAFLEAEAVVVAGGMKAEKGLAEALKARGIKFREIGDCVEPGRIRQALIEGYDAGMEI